MATAPERTVPAWHTRSRVRAPFRKARLPSLPQPAADRGRAMTDSPYNVLFLCTGNSARSIIAEAILNKVGAGNFRAYSAGSQPKGQVNPHAISLLRSLGYDLSGVRSKSWQEFARLGAPALDFV